MGSTTETKRVVLLVDNKQRDLLADTLIAHHLRRAGVECRLEPLEAYRGALAAWRPHLIVFNTLSAGHLAAYSRRLAGMGVRTAVLTNEGIVYDPDVLKFIVGSHHRDAHVDCFLCWNGELKRAMEELGAFPETRKAVVGIPRFDFYCHPWSRLFAAPAARREVPRLLFCANFAWADFHDSPKAAEVFLAVLKDRLPMYRDYRSIIQVQYQNRLRVFAFLDELVRAGRWDLTVRPHPYEKVDPYREWLEKLPAACRQRVRLDKDGHITSEILNTDLVITSETCTTAIEAWLARKPSIELTFAKHPIFFHEEHARQQPVCDRPQDLAEIVEAALAQPEQPAYAAGRQAHLRKWCHSTEGDACALTAAAMVEVLRGQPEPDWSALTAVDYRRAAKLKLTRAIGEAYHYDPLLHLKYALAPKRYVTKHFAYEKSIRPTDVLEAQDRLEQQLAMLGSAR